MTFDELGLSREQRQHVRQVAGHRTRGRRPGLSRGPGSALLLRLWNIVGHDDADASSAKPDSASAASNYLPGAKRPENLVFRPKSLAGSGASYQLKVMPRRQPMVPQACCVIMSLSGVGFRAISLAKAFAIPV